MFSAKKNLAATALLSVTLIAASNMVANAENPNGGITGADNYRVLETGMPGVIISPVKSDKANSQNGQAGNLYTASTVDNTDINYTFNRPVMTSTTKVYLIWYGTWSNPGASGDTPTNKDYKGFVTKYLNDLVGNGRWTLNANYYSAANSSSKTPVTDFVIQDQKFVVPAGKNAKTTLRQSDILNIAKNAYPSAQADGIYFVLTSSEVSVSGFGTSFCGWHSYDSTGNRKYSFVGDPVNVSGCKAQNVAPNHPGADAMLSILTHELEETVTDPALNAWYSSNGNENSDKCAWSWGNTSTAVNGSSYNLTMGGKNYLIQRNFKINASPKTTSSTGVVHAGSCTMS